MIKFIACAFIAIVGVVALSPSYAMPVTQIEGVRSEMVITIAGGCGRGFHRGPNGGCLPNFANPADHPCPRGYHVGPFGGCRGNGR